MKTTEPKQAPFSQEFLVGVNYWASDSGCFMWQRFNEQVITDDLKFLKSRGINVLRVFPLWSDFQPVKLYTQQYGVSREMRVNGCRLDTTPEVQAGVDPVMIESSSDSAGLHTSMI
jgi:endo-1,4-beta-mannosidase